MIYPDFITEEERLILIQWIEGLYQSRCRLIGVTKINELHLGIKLIDPPSTEVETQAYIDCIFGANPIANKEGEDVLGTVPPEVYKIKNRIMEKFNLRHYDARKTFMNYFLPGANLGSHRHYPPEGFADLRTNIMLQKPKGGEPICAERVFDVEERGLWVFNSNLQHWTKTISENKPRIVMGFGWDVPDFADVHWDGEPLPNPGPRWKYANIRKVNNKWVSDYYNQDVQDAKKQPKLL